MIQGNGGNGGKDAHLACMTIFNVRVYIQLKKTVENCNKKGNLNNGIRYFVNVIINYCYKFHSLMLCRGGRVVVQRR